MRATLTRWASSSHRHVTLMGTAIEGLNRASSEAFPRWRGRLLRATRQLINKNESDWLKHKSAGPSRSRKPRRWPATDHGGAVAPVRQRCERKYKNARPAACGFWTTEEYEVAQESRCARPFISSADARWPACCASSAPNWQRTVSRRDAVGKRIRSVANHSSDRRAGKARKLSGNVQSRQPGVIR